MFLYLGLRSQNILGNISIRLIYGRLNEELGALSPSTCIITTAATTAEETASYHGSKPKKKIPSLLLAIITASTITITRFVYKQRQDLYMERFPPLTHQTG